MRRGFLALWRAGQGSHPVSDAVLTRESSDSEQTIAFLRCCHLHFTLATVVSHVGRWFRTAASAGAVEAQQVSQIQNIACVG